MNKKFPILTFRLLWSFLSVLLCGALTASEPGGLSARKDKYFESAVSVFHQVPEVVEKDGRKYRVLLQDIESEKIVPKLNNRRGSGFFLFHEGEYYFATAQHVALKLGPSTRFRIVNSEGKSRQFIFSKLVGKEEQFKWRHHKEADVSLMKLHLPTPGIEEIADLALVTKDLYLKVPPRTAKLVVAGFPGGLGTLGGKVSPITAVVHLASEEISLGTKLMEGVPIGNSYLVSPPAGKGFSGAPIFYTLGDGQVKCMGMLSGVWSDATGGKFSVCMAARHLLSLVDK